MGLCQCASNTILTDMNLSEKNLVVDNNKDAEVNGRGEEKTKAVKSKKNESLNGFSTSIQKYGVMISPEAFIKLIPEKYYKLSTDSPAEFRNKKGKNKDKDMNDLTKENPVRLINGNYYWGYWNDKCEMSGPGQLYLPSDNVFVEGLWRNGILYKGRLLLPDDSIYEGKFEDCLYNGKGKLTYVDGRVYEGKFVNGQKHGNGSLYFPDGSKYWGEFSNDQIEGDGDFLWAGGYQYKGTFKNNAIDGKGTFTLSQGSSYTGEFKCNQFHGKGKFIWATGEKYDGEYCEGMKEGKGKYSMSNDIVFKGKWAKNRQHGKGTIETDNNEYIAYWRYGQMIEIISSNEKSPNETVDFNFIPLIEDIDANSLPYITHYKLDNDLTELNSFVPIQNIDKEVGLVSQ